MQMSEMWNIKFAQIICNENRRSWKDIYCFVTIVRLLKHCVFHLARFNFVIIIVIESAQKYRLQKEQANTFIISETKPK